MRLSEHQDYKRYLRQRIEENSGTRGYVSQLARAAGCQRSYFSQVIHGSPQLTPDHAIGLCELWGFGEAETEYFLGLVDLARAATPRLRKRISGKLASLRSRLESVAGRLQEPAALTSRQELEYYSSWHTVAVHLLCGFPGPNTASSISARLQLPRELVLASLELLLRLGLVSRSGERWRSRSPQIHLPKESPLAPIHHANWRHRAMLGAQKAGGDDLHFTVVHTLSRKDFARVRELLLETFEKTRKIVGPSPEEELVCLACDYFRV